MSNEDEVLFSEGDIGPTLANLRAKAVEEIGKLQADYLLKASEEDVATSLISKYSLEPLELLRDKLCVDPPREVDITYSGDLAFVYGRDGLTVKGTEITFAVPFRGDAWLFKLRPSRCSYDRPRARVIGQELHLTLQGVNMQGDQVKAEIERQLSSVSDHIAWQLEDVRSFNQQLPAAIRTAVAARKAKLTRDLNLVAAGRTSSASS